MMYLGDYAAGTTLDFNWSSNAADGSSITRATNGTVSVYKGNSTTETTTGVTDTEDFDSLTGIHHCRIVTSDSFYATGNDYSVVLSGATIDGKTVNAVLAHFSIQNRYPSVAAIADAVLDEPMEGHLSPDTMGRTIYDGLVDEELIADAVWDEPLADHDTAGTAGAALGAGGSSAADIADAVWDEAAADHVAAGSAGLALAYARDGSAVYGSTTAAFNQKKFFDGTGYTGPANSIGTVGTVTNTVNANLANIGGTAALFNALLALLATAVKGTVASGTNTTTVVTTTLPATANGFYVPKTFVATSGPNAGQGGKLVTAYDGATKRLTIEALTSPMTAGDEFVLLG